MFKFILALSAIFTSLAASARYPDGQCGTTETKLIFENTIVFGKRVQITNPKLCANGQYYSLLAWASSDRRDHASGLCALYQMGTYVSHDLRAVDHELLASFDDKGNFDGVLDYNARIEESYAIRALTCQLP